MVNATSLSVIKVGQSVLDRPTVCTHPNSRTVHALLLARLTSSAAPAGHWSAAPPAAKYQRAARERLRRVLLNRLANRRVELGRLHIALFREHDRVRIAPASIDGRLHNQRRKASRPKFLPPPGLALVFDLYGLPMGP